MPISKIKQASIDASALTGSNITDGTIAAADLATNAVTTAKISSGSVTNAKIAADAITTAKIADTVNLGRRNLVINGAMMIAQRSTSVSGQTTTGYKTVDRILTNASGSTYNQSQGSVTIGGETGLPGQFTKFLRHDVTTSNDNAHLYHRIEGVDSVPAGTVTLSFYAKGVTPTGGLSFAAYQNFGTGGSPSTEVSITISDTKTLTSTWQRFSINITVPSIAGKTLGTNGDDFFYFGIGQMTNTSSAAYRLDITGLQLEVGDTATPFEHRSKGEELTLCQRYYQMYKESGGTGSNAYLRYGYGTVENSTRAEIPINSHTIMRADPTLETTGSFNNYSLWQRGSVVALTNLTVEGSGHSNGQLFTLTATVASGLNAGDCVGLMNNNSQTAYLAFSAEL